MSLLLYALFMTMGNLRLSGLVQVFIILLAGGGTPATAGGTGSETLTFQVRNGNRIEVLAPDGLFTTFRFSDSEPSPCLFPVHGPGGVSLTRHYPFAVRDGEQADHPHHRSIWFAHGSVNGHDFWHGKAHRITCEEVSVHTDGGDVIIRSQHDWIHREGDMVCSERRRMHFARDGEIRTIDLWIELQPPDGRTLHLGDTKEGTMAIRLAPSLRIEGPRAVGGYLNALGDRDRTVWGRRAAWTVAHGSVDGQEVTIAMFDHPRNPNHPTWWHARPYGLFAANPFGASDFEPVTGRDGSVVVPEGSAITFAYRIMIYPHPPDPTMLQAAWQAWSEEVSPMVH